MRAIKHEMLSTEPARGASRHPRSTIAAVAMTIGIAALLSARPARSQGQASRTSAAAPAASNIILDQASMEATRRQFLGVMRSHPRFWSAVQADPSLMTDQEYLNRDPVLAAFFAQHPEVARDPDYFVGWDANFRRRGDEGWNTFWRDAAPMIVFLIILGALLWIFKVVLENRRWSRMTKIQTDLHNRLLEKFTTNEDLFAYMQTEPGKRFLEFVPVITDPERSPRLSAPFGRILWSFQAGLILALAGIGLLAIRSQFEAAAGGQALLVLGTLGLTIGVGFIIAAGVSYGLSRHLGLFQKLAAPKTAAPNLGEITKNLS